MNIIDAIKNENVRVTCGVSWLCWDKSAGEWVVLERPRYTKVNRTLYEGYDEQAAVAALIGE